jgi:mono/diheme cytochrome c family protein
MRSLLIAAAATLAYVAPTVQAGTLGYQAQPRANAESVATTSSVRSLYVLHCAGCHGMDGSGSSIGNVPDMRRLGLFLRLEGGREYLIKVPGVMGSGLTDQQVADVVNWVMNGIASASMPPNYQLYRAEEVRQARSTPMLNVTEARQRLTEQAQTQGIQIEGSGITKKSKLKGE